MKKLIFGLSMSLILALCGCAKVQSVLSQATQNTTLTTDINADGNYNILFITVDQEQYMEQYPAGSNYKARELLASMGTTFEKHYACSNMSTSSRSVIYTGTHITQTGMIDNTDFDWQEPMSEDLTTIGDTIMRAGYYSAYMGKWHMGDASVLSGEQSKLTSLDAYGFYDWNQKGDKSGAMWEGYEEDPGTTEAATLWLKEKGVAKNAEGQPFFLAVNFVNPHDIMYYNTDNDFVSSGFTVGGAQDEALFKKTYDSPIPATWNQNLSDGSLPSAVARFKAVWERRVGTVDTAEGWRDFRNYYFNCIQDSDNNLMTLLNAVKDSGLLDNTIIVFTADHGEMAGAHGLKGKGGNVFDESIHVPLIIVHPDYEGGRAVSSVTSHLDLAPTLLQMTNAEDVKPLTLGLPGKNLLELMGGKEKSVRKGALYCFEMISMTMQEYNRDTNGNVLGTSFNMENRGFIRCVITEEYKFARYFSAGNFNTPKTLEELIANNDLELYDLRKDRGETTNLAAQKNPDGSLKYADIIMAQNEILNRLIAEEIGVDDGREFSTLLPILKGIEQQ